MKCEIIRRKGKTLIRITVGGKSKAIKRAERRIAKRQREIREYFLSREA